VGETVSFIFEASAGDLAFFDNASGAITHVGIIIDGGRIIHASGKVRIDNIDHNGIFNQETGKYTHNLRIIRRVF
jgi:gamma-D-glutamyl-L-lysine dipeptidyl-peptidase